MKLYFKACPILFAVLFFCSSSLSQEIETMEGIRLVHNKEGGKWGENPKISIELKKTVGDIDTLDDNFAFNNPEEMAQDSDGNLYILDSGNHRVLKYSSESSFILRFGQSGQGPGDFQNPTSIEIDPQNIVYVADPRNNRISVFTPKGKISRTIQILNFQIQKIRYLSNSKFAIGGLHSTGRWADEKKSLPKLMLIIDANGEIQKEIGFPHAYEKWIENFWGNRYDFDIDLDGNFYLAFEHQNRIEKYSSKGELLWKADRTLSFDENDPEHMFTFIIGGRDGSNRAIFPAKMSQGIAIDGKGRSWVLGFNRHLSREETSSEVMSSTGNTSKRVGAEIKKLDVYKLEIFDGDGVLLGEIALDHLANGLRIYGDYLYIWEYENTKYYHYRIVEH